MPPASITPHLLQRSIAAMAMKRRHFPDRTLRPYRKVARPEVKHIVNRAIGINQEQQHNFASTTPVVIPTTLTVGTNCIDLTATYASVTGNAFVKNREGVRINNKNIRIRIVLNANTASTFQDVRIIVFKWRPTTTTYNPTEGLVLAVGNGTVAAASEYSFPAYSLQAQRTILYDKRVTLIAASDKSHKVVDINLFGNKLPKQSFFDNPASDTGSGHVYLWVSCNDGANQATWSRHIQYVWTDA